MVRKPESQDIYTNCIAPDMIEANLAKNERVVDSFCSLFPVHSPADAFTVAQTTQFLLDESAVLFVSDAFTGVGERLCGNHRTRFRLLFDRVDASGPFANSHENKKF